MKVKPKWMTDGGKPGESESSTSGSTAPSEVPLAAETPGRGKGKDDRILRLLRQANNEVHSYSALIARRSYEDLTKDGL